MLIAKKLLLRENKQHILDEFEEMNRHMEKLSHGLADDLVAAATWPDDIKGYGLFMWDSHHYHDTPIEKDGIESPKDTNKISAKTALRDFQTTIIKNKRHNLENSLALRMYIHILGDIFQPLHASSLYSKEFPKGDNGGNSFLVNLDGKEYRLHYLWDEAFFSMGSSFKVKP